MAEYFTLYYDLARNHRPNDAETRGKPWNAP
jgi:hypothetical protein